MSPRRGQPEPDPESLPGETPDGRAEEFLQDIEHAQQTHIGEPLRSILHAIIARILGGRP